MRNTESQSNRGKASNPAVFVGIAACLASLMLVRRGSRWVRRRFGRPPRRVRPPADLPDGTVDVVLPPVNGCVVRGWFLPAVAADQPRPAALVMHGWGADAADMLPVATPLRAAGLHVLMPDARCHGRSDDDEFTSMPRFAEDVRAGLTWLRGRADVDDRRIVLIGHSVGAGACLLVAATDADVAAVVSIASMADPETFMSRALAPHLPRTLTAFALRYVQHTIGTRFRTFAPVGTIGRVTAPVLLVHGARDTTVPVDDAYLLHAAAGGRAQLHVLPDADHTNAGAWKEAARPVLEFLRHAGVA